MLNPQTIALIGVTEKENTPARTLLENLCSWSNDQKDLHGQSSQEDRVGPSMLSPDSAVPEHIDLAIMFTPAATVPGIVEECGKVDTEGIIIISAGFREIGEKAENWRLRSRLSGTSTE